MSIVLVRFDDTSAWTADQMEYSSLLKRSLFHHLFRSVSNWSTRSITQETNKKWRLPPPSVASPPLLDMLIIEPGEKDRRRRLRVRRSRERAPSDDLAVQSQDAVKGTRFPRVSVRTSSCQPKKRSDERTNEHSSSSISSRDTTIIINCKHLQRVDILLTATSPFIINIGSSDYQRKVFSTVILLGWPLH